MLSITVDTSKYERSVARTLAGLQAAMTHGVTEGAKKGAAYARTHHPHRRRTGSMTSPQNLTHRFLQQTKTTSVAAIVNRDPAVRYVEYLTRPHYIFPRNPDGSLSFYSRKLGRTVVVDYVAHPGNRGKFAFMRPAARFGAQVAKAEIRHGIDMLTRMIWK